MKGQGLPWVASLGPTPALLLGIALSPPTTTTARSWQENLKLSVCPATWTAEGFPSPAHEAGLSPRKSS
jgi:hypothetical protein